MEPTPLQRALLAAPEKSSVETARPEEELFVFRLQSLSLAVDSKHVREVARLGVMTPLPRSPSFVLGVMGNRGQVVPVIDLLRFLQQGEAKPVKSARVFLGEVERVSVAFLADEVIGLRRILVADKLPPPAPGGVSNEFLVGLLRHRELGHVGLLDLARVLHAAHASMVRR